MFNKIVKVIATASLQIYVFLICYLVALLSVSPIMCITLSIISGVLNNIPEICSTKFWLVFLVSAIPLAILYFICVKIDQKKKNI